MELDNVKQETIDHLITMVLVDSYKNNITIKQACIKAGISPSLLNRILEGEEARINNERIKLLKELKDQIEIIKHVMDDKLKI